jgi:hypothetical protein
MMKRMVVRAKTTTAQAAREPPRIAGVMLEPLVWAGGRDETGEDWSDVLFC